MVKLIKTSKFFLLPVEAKRDLAGLVAVDEGGVTRRQWTGWRWWSHFATQMETCKEHKTRHAAVDKHKKHPYREDGAHKSHPAKNRP